MSGAMARAWGILALAIFFCATGVLFFFIHRDGQQEDVAVVNAGNIALKQESSRKKYIDGPNPEVFRSFVYTEGEETLVVEGACESVYSAVMLYPMSIDYRESPLDAVYNIAERCEGFTFARTIDLRQFAFREGEEYYVIRAQQGASGQWYNPK